MSNNIYKKFKKRDGGEYFEIVPYSADTAFSAATSVSAQTAANAEAIGNVVKYSEVKNGKQREGLKFKNGSSLEAEIELNTKGNFAIGSLTKASNGKGGNLNLESVNNVQVKPTKDLVLDTSNRINAGEGNQVNFEARFDDFGDEEYNGKDGYDEKWAEFKIKSRNLDLRCHEHGGIALQIAGKDKNGKENKIKFESDRTNLIGASGTYQGEGGKGLEFGTFNNEHASLYCGDYRFKGDAYVYAATRSVLETSSSGKIDYPTQPDDFKDVLDNTKRATWEEIINAAKQCSGLSRTVKEEIQAAALEAGGVDISDFVTRSNVETMVADAMQDAHIDTTGLATEQWVMGRGFFQVPSGITLQPAALSYIKLGKEKGNFAVDVTGKYTWELTSPKFCSAVDEFGSIHVKGDRILNYTNESFYVDENKVYYKAGDNTTLADGETTVPAGTIVFGPACADVDASVNFPEGTDEKDIYEHYVMSSGDTEFYEDPTKFFYKAKKGAKYFDGTSAPKDTIIHGSSLTQEEIDYYDSKGEIKDEDGTVIQAETWKRTDLWKKSTLWSMNEININLETDSKIKFDGKKIETCWGEDENENPIRMDDILLFTNTLTTDANEVVFEKKISKNGDRSGQDSEIVYTFGNNVADPEKVADFAAFKANYSNKHKGHTKTDEELQAMYDAFLAEGPSFEIRVKVSELLGLVSKVAELEGRIEALEGGNG